MLLTNYRYGMLPAAVCAVALLSACSTEPPTEFSAHMPPSPAIDLGPEFKVLDASKYKYSLAGIPDSMGRAHLIVGKSMEVLHLVIGPQGVETSEAISNPFTATVTFNSWPASVDLAFDEAGNLHALADDEHFVKKDGKWLGGQRTPWHEAGSKPAIFRPSHPAFVKGARNLTWSFTLSSDQIGLPCVIEGIVTGFGPAPSPTYYSKPMIVPEEKPYRHWYALGMEFNKGDLLSSPVSAEQDGTLNVFYEIPYFIGGDLRHASFRLDAPCPKPPANAWYVRKKVVPKLNDGTPVCPIQGGNYYQQIHTLLNQQSGKKGVTSDDGSDLGPGGNLAISVDPASGNVLWVGYGASSTLASHDVRHVVLSDMPMRHFQLVVEPAGKNRFHALAISTGITRDGGDPVFYLEYSDGKWSAPIEIGTFPSDPFWLHPEDKARAFRIISAGNGRALLVWPHEDALVARWVTLK